MWFPCGCYVSTFHENLKDVTFMWAPECLVTPLHPHTPITSAGVNHRAAQHRNKRWGYRAQQGGSGSKILQKVLTSLCNPKMKPTSHEVNHQHKKLDLDQKRVTKRGKATSLCTWLLLQLKELLPPQCNATLTFTLALLILFIICCVCVFVG